VIKQIIDRDRSSRTVVSVIEQHKAAIAKSLEDMLAEAAATLEVPAFSVGVLLDLFAETVRSRTAELVEASRAHEQEAVDDAGPRLDRDAREVALRQHLSALRKVVEGYFGDPGLRNTGFWEPLPAGPDPLKHYGEGVYKALAATEVVLTPRLLMSSDSFNRAEHAAVLRGLIDPLAKALGDVTREAAQLGGTQLVKNTKLERNDVAVSRIAGILEQMARLAGLPEVADRMRAADGSPGVLIEVRDRGEADTDAPTDGDAPVDGGAPAVAPKPRIAPGMPGAEPFDDET